jgi:hypothetical protein
MYASFFPPQAEMCGSSVVEILQAVVEGVDGCLFCYGHAGVGRLMIDHAINAK